MGGGDCWGVVRGVERHWGRSHPFWLTSDGEERSRRVITVALESPDLPRGDKGERYRRLGRDWGEDWETFEDPTATGLQ